MAWTAPRTWVTGEVVTANLLNVQLRNNLLAIDTLLDMGVASFVVGGVLLGNGTGTIQAMSALAKGGLIVGDGAGAPQALAIGADGSFLVANDGTALGVEWSTASIETFMANPEDVQKYF